MEVNKKTRGNKLVLDIPKEIRELAQEFRRQRVAKRQRKREDDANKKCVRAGRLKAGLKYATKVFLWAEALKESDIGQELMKKSHIPFIFFDGNIVGVPWVGLGISPEGLFLTRGGRFSHHQQILTRGLLAEAVRTVTLEAASEWIDNGEVWNCIKRRFDYLKK